MAYQGSFLFRALTAHDDTTTGLRPTAPYASPYARITVKAHVERGGFDVHKPSQFISTTKDLSLAIRWVRQNKSTLAIILRDRLGPNVRFHDISEGYRTLSPRHNNYAIWHSEVLLEASPLAVPGQPLVHPDAVWLSSYDDLVEIHKHPSHLIFPQALQQLQYDFHRLLREEFSRCAYCSSSGHCYNNCRGLSDWFDSEDAIERYFKLQCYFCRDYGHDTSTCQGFSDWEASEVAIERCLKKLHCYFCMDYGHDDSTCQDLSDWLA